VLPESEQYGASLLEKPSEELPAPSNEWYKFDNIKSIIKCITKW
jgi:hypothetical protein